jgi:putative NADPH-quinone reductase
MAKRQILAVLGHPDSESYNRAVFDSYVGALSPEHEVTTLRLGELKFDPVLRFGYRQRMDPDPVIERSQELIRWADHFVFVFPCWWANMSSLLKGWFDRVFTPGVAYNDDNSSLLALGFKGQKHLKGKTATIIVTFEGPPWWFTLTGLSPARLVRRENLGFCGVKVTQTLKFGWVGSPTKDSPERRAKFLAKAARAATAL